MIVSNLSGEEYGSYDLLSVVGGSITGTPTTETATATYVASADDGSAQVTSQPFTLEVKIAAIDVEFERATPEQIGIYIPLSPSPAAGTTGTVRYRLAGAATWGNAP